MFGDKNHDREVANGTVAAGGFAAILAIVTLYFIVDWYTKALVKNPKKTIGLTALVWLVAGVVSAFSTEIGYGYNWLTLADRLPDGEYVVLRRNGPDDRTPRPLVIKDGKIAWDSKWEMKDGKGSMTYSFREVKWERDIKKNVIVMIDGSHREELYERRKKETYEGTKRQVFETPPVTVSDSQGRQVKTQYGPLRWSRKYILKEEL